MYNMSNLQNEIETMLKQKRWSPEQEDQLPMYKLFVLAHMSEELGEISRNVTYLETPRGEYKNINRSEVINELELELGDLLFNIYKLAISYNIKVEDSMKACIDKLNNK